MVRQEQKLTYYFTINSLHFNGKKLSQMLTTQKQKWCWGLFSKVEKISEYNKLKDQIFLQGKLSYQFQQIIG